MVSGGILVAGGLVIGSAVSPLRPANDNSPATLAAEDPITAPEPTKADAGTAVAGNPAVTDAAPVEPAAENAKQPEPEVKADDPAPEPQPEPTPEPAEAPPTVTAADDGPVAPEAPTPEMTEPEAPAPTDTTAPEATETPAPLAETMADAPAAAPEATPAPGAKLAANNAEADKIAGAEAAPEAETAAPEADAAVAATTADAKSTAPKPEAVTEPAATPDPATKVATAEEPAAPEAAPEVTAEAEPAPDAAPAEVAVAEPAPTDPVVVTEASPDGSIEPTPEATADAPAAPTPAVTTEEAPESAPETAPADPVSPPAAEAAEAPVVEPAPEPEAPAAAPAAPEAPVPESPAPETPATEAPEAGAMPEALDDGSDMPGTEAEGLPGTPDATAPEDTTQPETGSTFAPAPSLIGKDQGAVVRRGSDVEAPPEAATDPAAIPADTRPIVQFAAAFENTEAKPPLAIVLVDDGAVDLDRAGLAALPFPVSFALDPLDPATPDRAAIYRAAGHEVVMLVTGIADGAQATDVEVAFQSMAQGLPEAVAVLDLANPAFQNNRSLASAVVPILKAQGRGLLTRDEGLNAADQVARREDLEAAVVFRDLDTAGDDKVAMRRLLDRAVFKAGQDGRVSVVGNASPETVAALLEWTVEGKAATVALAPVTAVLKVD